MKYREVKKMILRKLKNELPSQLTYHSIFHTKDVLSAATRIAKNEKVRQEDVTLIKTAALFHDSGFIFGPKEHEEKSCDIARRYLPEYDYSDEQIDKICGMIRATKIPQQPLNHLEEILADADLDYLGRDDFDSISRTLYQEMVFFGILDNVIDWNRVQVRFFNNHHYFTQTAKDSRQSGKEKHLQKIKAELEGN